MSSLFVSPAGYRRIKVVDSFDELVAFPMGPTVNAVCWARTITGDFDALAECFRQEEDIVSLDEEMLCGLKENLSPAGKLAADVLRDDKRLLQTRGLQPSIECVPRYLRDGTAEIVPTDVYSFHVDRATVATDTYLCSYNEAATEGLRNDMAQRHIDVQATRAKLQQQCRLEEAGDFETYLRENCYDLHYAALADALPFSFGIGHLWRIAVEYPGCPVPPCIHRAPATTAGRPPRLLLIS